ncbi:MAG TPA: hypothetical protein VLM85_03855 [Polyangiaceae bacterium]|nr:hypothetical protein [Polyangiaceae bacterium]
MSTFSLCRQICVRQSYWSSRSCPDTKTLASVIHGGSAGCGS